MLKKRTPKVLVRYGVHLSEETGTRVGKQLKSEMNLTSVAFHEMPRDKTLHFLLLKNSHKIDYPVFEAQKKLLKLAEEARKTKHVLRVGAPLPQSIVENHKKTAKVLNRPEIKKSMNVVEACFKESYEHRRKLNEQAHRQGYLPIELHTHGVGSFGVRYHPKFKSHADKLKNAMMEKGYTVVVSETDRISRKMGPHITLELPGQTKPTRLSKELDQKVPRFLRDKQPASWAAHSYVPTKPQIKKSKSFVRDVIHFFLRV